MKKLFVSILAVGAIGFGSAASAQDVFGLGHVLPQILGNIGVPGVPIYGAPGVLGGVPQEGTTVIDPYGRRIVYDRYGRAVATEQLEIVVDKQGRRWAVDSEGNHTQIGQDFGGLASRGLRGSDLDRDGVPDRRDRYPHDPRYR